MWLRLGFIVLRLGIRLAPFVAAAAAGLLRRYRWPLYYKSLAYRQRVPKLPPLGLAVGLTLAGLILLGIGLYVAVGLLAPR